YGLTSGQIFHGELALDQFFTMRPLLDLARYRTPITNLYLCGSGTHPGAGLTGGSGANAAREILKSMKESQNNGVLLYWSVPGASSYWALRGHPYRFVKPLFDGRTHPVIANNTNRPPT